MPEQHYRVETYRARDSVGYLLRRLHGIWLARFEAVLARAGMTLTQWIVLIQLRDGFSHTASDIAYCLQHDSGALTRVIDQLERRGLVTRRRSASDRRVVELGLTAKGRTAVAGLLPAVVEQTNRALEPLSRDEFREFKLALERILDHVQHNLPPIEAESAQREPRQRARARTPARSKRTRGKAKVRRRSSP
jgi:DNA-binding MarR family transcriptional regulator